MPSARYREGDWFAVPLLDDGFAVGVIARANARGVVLGYFFGPRRFELPTLRDVEMLTPDESLLIGTFGHLGLKSGSWPILGRLADWDRNTWRMPAFARFEELTGKWFKMFYADDDPNRLLAQEAALPSAVANLP